MSAVFTALATSVDGYITGPARPPTSRWAAAATFCSTGMATATP
jgi:hypothetical protein